MKKLITLLFIAGVLGTLIGCADNGTNQEEINGSLKTFKDENQKHPDYGPDPDVAMAPPAGSGGGSRK